MSAILSGAVVLLTGDAFDLPTIRKDLTFTQKKTSALSAQQTLHAYHIPEQQDGNHCVRVPKQYALTNVAELPISGFIDQMPDIQSVDVAMNLPLGLRQHQKDAKTAIMDLYNAHQQYGIGCLVELPCG